MRKSHHALFLFLFLVACGSSGGGGGGGDDDGSGSGMPDAGTPANVGTVALSSQSYTIAGTSVQAGTAFATFAKATGAACTEEVMGACTLATCPTTSTMPTYYSAGTVTVTGAAMPIMLAPKTDKTYQPLTGTQALFTGGATLAVSASGGDVPGFDASVTAPSRATLMMPVAPALGSPISIPRAQAFHATWNGGGAAKLVITIGGPTGSGTSLSCVFDAAAGSGDVPASALGKLSTGTGTFSASTIATTTKDAGDWRISVSGTYSAVFSNLSIAAAQATLQ